MFFRRFGCIVRIIIEDLETAGFTENIITVHSASAIVRSLGLPADRGLCNEFLFFYIVLLPIGDVSIHQHNSGGRFLVC